MRRSYVLLVNVVLDGLTITMLAPEMIFPIRGVGNLAQATLPAFFICIRAQLLHIIGAFSTNMVILLTL